MRAAFVWPGVTFEVLVLLFGAYAFVDGVLAIVTAVVDAGVAVRDAGASPSLPGLYQEQLPTAITSTFDTAPTRVIKFVDPDHGWLRVGTGRGGVEPNLHITPDKKWVVFTGQFAAGQRHVYAVEIAGHPY